MEKLCECNCGEPVKRLRGKLNSFIKGHGRRSKRYWDLIKIKYCECGCGELVKRRFLPGHNSRNRSQEILDKISNSLKGFKQSEEQIEKLSKRMMGNQYNKGRKQTKEHRNNIGIAGKGKKRSEVTKQRMSKAKTGTIMAEETKELLRQANLGKKLSEQTKQDIGKASKIIWSCPEYRNMMSLLRSGPLHWNWQGGISSEPYCSIWTKEFKEFIKERDNNECQNPDCWGTAIRLGVHHIDYDKKNCDPWNLICLCTSCNTRSNYNRNYWQKFYEDIMKERCLNLI
ncbi:hypothetical protein LCGC14_0458620 [marine sediment metagenome]|uniref:HNH nuclease domain-containing protein n=1 Tax=marine sediment metagenome TaxID=412755 RepID=A0A0F9SKZ0_9ZZZZ